jgi:hypothetical protein
MANDDFTTDRPDTSSDPGMPPGAFQRPEVARGAILSYIGPIIVLFAVVGVALIYWVNREPFPIRSTDERGAVGTSGQFTQGGGDPRPPFRSTTNEIETRGADTANTSGKPDLVALTTIDRIRESGAASGREVTLSAVRVERVDGRTMWVREGDSRIAVQLPEHAAPPQPGDRVDVSGITDAHDGMVRIVADAIHTK